MDAAEGETDVPKRMAHLRDAEALMLSEQPIAPLFHYVTLHVFDPGKVKYLVSQQLELAGGWNWSRWPQ